MQGAPYKLLYKFVSVPFFVCVCAGSSHWLLFIINALIFSFGALSHLVQATRKRKKKNKIQLSEFMQWKFSQFYCHFFRLLANTNPSKLVWFSFFILLSVCPTRLLLHISVCKHKNIEIDISQVNKFQMRCHTAKCFIFFFQLRFVRALFSSFLRLRSTLFAVWYPIRVLLLFFSSSCSLWAAHTVCRIDDFCQGKLVAKSFSLFSTSLHSIWIVHSHFSCSSLALVPSVYVT